MSLRRLLSSDAPRSVDREQHLLTSLRELRKSHEYSDLKILCGGQTFDVHKAIVCPRSSFLRAACSWNQKKGLKHEVELKDDDPKMISLMIDFLYCADYDDEIQYTNTTLPTEETAAKSECEVATVSKLTGSKASKESTAGAAATKKRKRKSSDATSATEKLSFHGANKPMTENKKASASPRLPAQCPSEAEGTQRLVVNVLMYALGDKYDVSGLKALAQEKFRSAVFIQRQMRTVSFIRAANLAFTTTPSSDRVLRDLVVNEIISNASLIKYPEFVDLLESVDEMALSIARASLEHLSVPSKR